MLAVVGTSTAALAQEAGTSASAVFVEDSSIVIDGELDEWANFPAVVTVGGPQPSADPGMNGRLRWQVAADSNTIFFAATITDATIVAGQNGGNYWNEDSLEFYLNLSDDLAATTYGPGISQIRISAVDIGATDPTALTLTGFGLEQHEVTGFVFETNDGWGTEIAVDVSGLLQPSIGERFGLQIQANGSSGGDRDLKVSWSAADLFDTSFEDPSVFAQGVFVSPAATAADTESVAQSNPADTVGAAGAEVIDEGGIENDDTEAQEVESIADGGPAVVTGDEQRRSLLIAAVVSSISVFLGGLWFERKRKADEARHRAERKAAPTSGPVPDAADGVEETSLELEIDDKEFEAMLESILDEDASTD